MSQDSATFNRETAKTIEATQWKKMGVPIKRNMEMKNRPGGRGMGMRASRGGRSGRGR